MNFNVREFVVFMVLIYSSNAGWEIWKSSPPIVPKTNDLRNCENWIMYHGFLEIPQLNRAMALERAKIYDYEASVWAASYAYFISSFTTMSLNTHVDVTPDGFCKKHISPLVETPYVALKDEVKMCQEWIHLYGYYKHDTENNWLMVDGRDREDDLFVHVWVTMFSMYVEKENKGVTPGEFCFSMGKFADPVSIKLPFATLQTLLPCYVWIKYSDYTDDAENNIEKATNQIVEYYPYLSKWTLEYINYLIKFKRERDNGGLFIILLGPTPMTPEQFCQSIGLDYPNLVHYHILEVSIS